MTMTMTTTTMLATIPLKEAALEPARALWEAIVAHAPSVFSALLLVLIMWGVAYLARSLVVRLLGLTKLDHVAGQTRLAAVFDAFDGDLTASKAVGHLVYLAILLMALMSASDILGLTAVSAAFAAALAFVPRLVSALLVLGIGGYAASAARRAVGAMLEGMRSPYAGPVELAAEVSLLVVTAAIAVDVLGVDISFITSNITVLIGVVLATLAFLLCWSMRKPAEEIIANYYLRRLINPGDRIEFGGVTGTVESFTAIGVLVRDERGAERFVPARHVLDGLNCKGRARAKSSAKG